MKKIYRNILFFLITLAIIFSVIVGTQRYMLESDYQRVETVMSLGKVRELALKEGFDEYELLKKLKINGLTSIAIQEDNIETLMFQRKIAFWDSSEIVKQSCLYEDKLVDRNDVLLGNNLLICQDYSLVQRIREYLQDNFGKNQIQEISPGDDQYGLIITGDKEELIKLGLGFSEEDIKKVQSLDFNVILRPKNSPRVRTEVIQNKLLAMESVSNVSMIIFDEEEVLGYPSPEYLKLTAKFLQENNYPFGIIEFTSQQGIDAISHTISELTVRVHSITKEEMEKITQNKAIERWIRAAQERNIRLFYLNPFLNIRTENIVEANLNYLDSIRKELSRNGFSIGKASLFPNYQIPLIYIYIIGMGIIAAGVFLLEEFFNFQDRYNILLLVIGLFFIIFFNIFASKILLIKILALANAMIFPALAILKNKKYLLIPYSIEENKNHSFIYGVNFFIEMIRRIIFGVSNIMVFSLIGGLLVSALLTHYQFILAIRLFSGIKISYIIPLLLITVYLWWKDNTEKIPLSEEIKKPILFEHALLVFILLTFLVIYIARSGNFSFLPVPGLEEKMRVFLEQILIARPRSKEFLIGYPLLAFAIALNFMRIKYLKYIIIIMGTVAPVTVLNTFCHVHTPIYFSLLRTFHGYWLGLLLGIILATIFYFSRKIFRERLDERRS
ncbi:MAG: DUF5693 family protein [Atribacterota bacterium]|nr:DUF5693 family protein [Atribacterota bacterium]